MQYRLILAFGLNCLMASAQRLTFGVIAGANLTDDVRSGQQTYSGGTLPNGQTQTNTFIIESGGRSPIIGLQLEYQLPRNWAIEFDALHRELKSTESSVISPPYELPNGQTISRLGPNTRTLGSWEFPLLAKYRLPGRTFRPFFTAGPSFRPAGTGTQLSHVGITAGGGLELLTHGFRISPTVRYTRWADNGGFFDSPLLNQVEFLVGFDRPSTTNGTCAFGRRMSIGVIAGIGLGDDFKVGRFNGSQRAESNSGIVGVMLEAPLTEHWSVEANALYRPLHGTEPEFNRRVRFAHLTWEFPVLAKYRFRDAGRLRPFVEGGPSFRAEGNLNLKSVSHFGGTVGAGVETRWWRAKISPMVRYTRWGAADNSEFSHTWANQTQLLVSFAF
ncbi:MAG: outer membrane beta-barrel protein [Bryobacterales bacterium]|nr:outer membrane beta-barrel protein [Bryobacterales bacterium]